MVMRSDDTEGIIQLLAGLSNKFPLSSDENFAVGFACGCVLLAADAKKEFWERYEKAITETEAAITQEFEAMKE
jgi:hypothetical protein